MSLSAVTSRVFSRFPVPFPLPLPQNILRTAHAAQPNQMHIPFSVQLLLDPSNVIVPLELKRRPWEYLLIKGKYKAKMSVERKKELYRTLAQKKKRILEQRKNPDPYRFLG
eukprot:TRINITY_DN252_c0_g1::TRINITY_DN252_c0_g1_i1::g.1663::m.1663 TRINITY_DN252_c0_g1::TRINITY_DN252_c0_g1_i1::g.1663  ORF type:complete len:111 (-),score=14.08,Tautomerase_2/PF14552.1/0.078 TRINITY_DN252_c0_g1_i1:162-494(-)